MRCSPRTLLIGLAVAPPVLACVYAVLQPAGRMYWAVIFTLALVVCAPLAVIRIAMLRQN